MSEVKTNLISPVNPAGNVDIPRLEIDGSRPTVSVTSRTALAAVDTDVHTVYLNEGGRSGVFAWRAGDYSAEVAADTEQGIYVASASVAATVGAWVRQFDGAVFPAWFGSSGSGDSYSAIESCISVADITNKLIELDPYEVFVSEEVVVPADISVRASPKSKITAYTGFSSTKADNISPGTWPARPQAVVWIEGRNVSNTPYVEMQSFEIDGAELAQVGIAYIGTFCNGTYKLPKVDNTTLTRFVFSACQNAVFINGKSGSSTDATHSAMFVNGLKNSTFMSLDLDGGDGNTAYLADATATFPGSAGNDIPNDNHFIKGVYEIVGADINERETALRIEDGNENVFDGGTFAGRVSVASVLVESGSVDSSTNKFSACNFNGSSDVFPDIGSEVPSSFPAIKTESGSTALKFATVISDCNFEGYLDIDDVDGIAEAQTLGGAGSLTLNGALADLGTGGTFELADTQPFGTGSLGVRLRLFSTGNLSAVTFTVTGTDENGDALVENVTGPNSGFVLSDGYFQTITAIAADAAVGTDVIAGVRTYLFESNGNLSFDTDGIKITNAPTWALINGDELSLTADDAQLSLSDADVTGGELILNSAPRGYESRYVVTLDNTSGSTLDITRIRGASIGDTVTFDIASGGDEVSFGNNSYFKNIGLAKVYLAPLESITYKKVTGSQWHQIGGKTGLVTVTAANLADVGNAINTSNKFTFREALNTTDSKKYLASGAAAADTWVSVDGATTISPA